MQRVFVAAALVACFLPFARQAAAHHSVSMYDQSKPVTVKGTVKTFQWINPHVLAFVEADAKGDQPPQVWRLEMSSPGNLTRLGHSKRSLNPGDVVTVECFQMRDGAPGGLVNTITLANGRVMTFRFADLEQLGLK